MKAPHQPCEPVQSPQSELERQKATRAYAYHEGASTETGWRRISVVTT